MANAPYIPPRRDDDPIQRSGDVRVHERVVEEHPTSLEYESVAPTGVRKVLDAFEERDVQRIRWSAVIAGLFIAVGTQVLLGLLGAAIGLTAIDASDARPLAGLGLGAGIYMAVASLVALFVGGYAAAKLSGSIRRVDGVLSGVLTWATSLVVTLFLLGGLAGGAAGAFSNMVRVDPDAPTLRQGIDVRAPGNEARLDDLARRNVDDGARAAWGAFGGAVISLLAAVVGGAVGAVGASRTRRDERHPATLR